MIDTITITGGLPRDAVLRWTPAGAAVAEFTLAASNNRYNDETKQWEKTRSMYLDVTIWNERKQNNPIPWAELAETLRKGDQVAVVGQLHTKQWEDGQGNKRSKVEFAASRFYNLPDSQSSQPQQGARAAEWDNQPNGGFGQSNTDEPPF